MYDDIRNQARQAVTELLDCAKLKAGDIFVVGGARARYRDELLNSTNSQADFICLR